VSCRCDGDTIIYTGVRVGRTHLLGAFVSWGKTPIRFLTSVLPPACIIASSTERVSIKFVIGDFHGKLSIDSKRD